MPKILGGLSTDGVIDAGLGFRHGSSSTPSWTTGIGAPEGAITAAIGSLYSRLDGSNDTALYRKEAAGTTGWVAVSSSAGGAVTSVDGRTGVVTLGDLYVNVSGDNMTGNLGLGFPSPTAKLQFASSASATGGIRFGTDTNLYRSAAAVVRTDGALSAGTWVDAESGFRHGSSTEPTWTTGNGAPEGAVTAPVGSLYSRTDGTTDTTIYRKEFGVGSAGWVADSGAPVASVDGRTGVVTLSDVYVNVGGDIMTGALDLSKNELRNAVTHKLAAAPASPVEAQRYYDTTTKVERFWNGTSWVSPVSPVSSVDGRTGAVTLSDLYVDTAGDNMTGNLGFGVPAPTAKLQFAADTVAAGGILFGTDANLYRSAANVLHTDGRIEAGLSATTGGFRQGASGPLWIAGSGTPEGTATAPIGSIFSRTNGAANTALYRKETGTGNTGWAAITSGVTSVDGMTGVVDLTTKYVELAGDTMTGQLHTPILSTGAVPAQQGALRLTNADALWSRNNSNTGDLRLLMMSATHVLQLGTTGTTGVGIANAGTGGSIRTLWVSNDNNPTTAAGGISFGSSADTNLYRYAAGGLKTDGNVYIATGSLGVGAGPNAINRVDIQNAATHTSGFGSMALRATNAWQTASNSTGYLTGGIHVVSGNIGVGVTLTNAASDAVVAHTGHANIQGDGTYAVVANAVMGKVTKSGAGTLSEARSFLAFSPDSAGGGTISIATGLDIETQKLTGITTGYGIYQRGATDLNYFNGYMGLGVTAPTARLQFVSATAAAGGILFGTDVNLYRSTTDTLKTDDSLVVGVRVDALSGFRHGSSTAPSWTTGAGTPEGVVTAPVGSLFSRTDGGTGTALYRKETGTGNTGWIATATSAGGVTSVDGRTGVVTLSDLYVDTTGDTMTGTLAVTPAHTTWGINRYGVNTEAYVNIATAEGTFGVMGVQARGIKQGAGALTSTSGVRGVAAFADIDGSGNVTEAIGVEAGARNLNATATLTSAIGLRVESAGTGTNLITNTTGITIKNQGRTGTAAAIGLNIHAQTGASTINIGAQIQAASTTTLWLSSNADNTTAAAGIAFGSSRDTNLYRSAAGTAKTDGSVHVLNRLGVGTTGPHADYRVRIDHVSPLAGYQVANFVNNYWANSANATFPNEVGATDSWMKVEAATGTTVSGGMAFALGGLAIVAGAGAVTTSSNSVIARSWKYDNGTLDTLRAFWAMTPTIVSGPGNIANAYGLDIGAQKVTGVTNGYGIYQRGASDLNYFAGTVGIGAVATADYQLYVAPIITRTSPTFYGAVIQPYNNGTASVTGLSVNPGTPAVGAAALLAVDAGVRVSSATGTLTEGTAFRALGPTITAGGTIATAVALDLGTQKVTGVTTAYGILQRGTTDTNSFAGPITSTNTITALTLSPTGMTGAVQFSRYAGATAGGAPTSGSFLQGDWVIDRANGRIYICTVAGSPGTWVNAATGVAPNTGWLASGVTTDKTFTATSTTVNELANVLGTLIEALKTAGILGAP